MTTVTRWDILDASHTALRDAVASLSDHDWASESPCTQWNVTQVLQHAAGDQLAYVAAITGDGGPGYDPFAPSGSIDGDPAALLEAAIAASAAAFGTVAPDAESVPTPLPQGALAPWIAVGAASLDAAVHAWDIAMAVGRPSPLTPEMSRQLLAVAVEIVEPLRAWGAYAPVVPDAAAEADTEAEAEAAAEADTDGKAEAEADDDAAKLLRYLGRRPGWKS